MASYVDFNHLLATPEPADLGPNRRSGTKPVSELNVTLEQAAAKAEITPAAIPMVRALLLLWHDHLDAAHTIVQNLGGTDAAFIHGIMHRREPDYGNAAYWFRRVGTHASFQRLAERVSANEAVRTDGELLASLLPGGVWNACNFIDACEGAAGSKQSVRAKTLREIQRIETETLLEHLLCSRT